MRPYLLFPVVFAACSALAQRPKEVDVFGHWTSLSGQSYTSGGAKVGMNLTPTLVAEIGVTWDRRAIGATGETVFLGGRLEFDIAGDVTPYIRADISFHYSGSKRIFTPRSGAGAEYNLSSRTAVFAELYFFRLGGFSDTTTAIDLGLRFRFK
jgi:hypothetical protein